MSQHLTVLQPGQMVITLPESAEKAISLFTGTLACVRDDIRDNVYLQEALRVLPVGGYRSAIGAVWNAVVDDLRNKILHRSIALFNKSITFSRPVKNYEDFQDLVNDDQLIEGAYKIGVIDWEGSRILRHAKDTRHVFSGHPRSGDPTIIKVLAMLEDCVKYVLGAPYPAQIVDIDDYLAQMASQSYDRNKVAIENAFSDLPDIYQNELTNRLFTTYCHEGTSSIMRSNIEFAAPILWASLDKEKWHQVIRRVDQVITKGNAIETEHAFNFTTHVAGQRFLTTPARRYMLEPLVKELTQHADNWQKENELVRRLEPYAAYMPDMLIRPFVTALTIAYVGYIGSSASYSRKDFYADGAAMRIPGMFQAFDDKAAAAFVNVVQTNTILRTRIASPTKLNRLRVDWGNILLRRISPTFSDTAFLQTLVDPAQEETLSSLLKRKS